MSVFFVCRLITHIRADPTDLRKFVILSVAKNLPWQRVDLIFGRAGACPRREFSSDFYGSSRTPTPTICGKPQVHTDVKNRSGAQCTPLRVIQTCHSERSEESHTAQGRSAKNRLCSGGYRDPPLRIVVHHWFCAKSQFARARTARPYVVCANFCGADESIRPYDWYAHCKNHKK